MDLSGFDTSNVTDMDSMFFGCSSLTQLDLSGFDTSNVTNMNCMIYDCPCLTKLDLSGFNTKNVTNMSSMFLGCSSLTQLDLSGFDTKNVISMADMFYNCSGLTQLDLSGFDTKNVTMLPHMFFGCSGLTNLDLSSFDASEICYMGNMFEGCHNLKILKTGKGFNAALVGSFFDNSAKFPVKMFNYETAEKYEVMEGIPPIDYVIYVSDLSIDPDDEIESDTTNVSRGTFTTVSDYKPRTYSGDEGFYYKDSYFYEDATKYNQSLATMSLCMAFTTYGYMDDYDSDDYSKYDRNVKALMTKCGFANKELYEQYNFNEKPTADFVGCAIGSKTITVNDKDIKLIAVAVRGGGYESEWASNFDVGKTGDHNGFDLNADRVKDYIVNYITSKGIKGNVKIWITGYSRAAAVATQTAAKLNDFASSNEVHGFAYMDDDSETGYNRVEFNMHSIYAYGFATPAGAIKDSNPHGAKYKNIFSIIEYNDPVPLVAPGK